MESKNPLRWLNVGLLISCLPSAAGADPASNSAVAGVVQTANPFLLVSVALLLLTAVLGWLCLRLKQQNMRNQSSALSALSAMREMVEALQQSQASLRHQLIEQTSEVAQLKAHPGQLTLQPCTVALARSSAQH